MLTGVTQAGAPSAGVVVGAGLAALVATVLVFGLLGHFITAAHEGGHALMILLTGGRIDRVELHLNQDGGTTPGSRMVGLDHVLALLAGYSAPSLFGVAGAVVLAHGHPAAVLWTSVVLLALLLTTTRPFKNLWGTVVVLVLGLGLLYVVRRGSDLTVALVACGWVWFLLLGGLVQVLQDGAGASDLQKLSDRSLVPSGLWSIVFAAFALAAIGYGGLIMLGAVSPPV